MELVKALSACGQLQTDHNSTRFLDNNINEDVKNVRIGKVRLG